MDILSLSSPSFRSLSSLSKYSTVLLSLFLLWWCANSLSDSNKTVPIISCEEWASNCVKWSKISISKHIEQSLYIIEQIVYIKLQSENDQFIDFWGYVDLFLKFRIQFWEKRFNELLFYFDTLLSSCDDMIEETWNYDKYELVSKLIDDLFLKLSLLIQKNDPLEVESFINEMKNLWFYYNSVLKTKDISDNIKRMDI